MGASSADRLRASLARQDELIGSTLVLNPVENFPFREDLAVVAGPMHGLYNSDKCRDRDQRISSSIQFSGRQALEADSQLIYSSWAKELGAADATLRLLSGLHAHIVLFMAMAEPGQTVMLLPVEAGGHLSGKAILERLGLTVVEMSVDNDQMCVDIPSTLERCEIERPDYIFVDRSEGLVFEDFGRLVSQTDAVSVFDASQYLTNIVAGDYPNPFDWGFGLMISSLHKNFPGPQKALVATRERNDLWQRILSGISTFVSNMHTASTYAAGLTLGRAEWLDGYSRAMLDISVRLEEELHERRVPVVRRPSNSPPTHHVWIREQSRESAFSTYERLERCRILTNFRVLPYSLGHGLRLGVSAAARLGMTVEDVPRLADLIAQIRRDGATPALKGEAFSFNRSIWSRLSAT